MAAIDRARLPFEEQIAAVRLRTAKLIPTRRWTDLMRNAHDRAFVVAGAMKTGLLADFAAAVEKTIADGKSIGWFREQFDAIVDKHGWAYTGERNWRSRVIYTTNMRTSYAAGRLAQLRDPELREIAPYWIYRHGGSAEPRPQHLAWDGLTLAADDAWWDTHYPPNGWGCSCYVTATREQDIERLGGRLEENPPMNNEGIDPGWDYQPGADVADELRDIVASKAEDLPGALARALREDSPQTTSVRLISSQRYLDEDIVEQKINSGDFTVKLSPLFTIDGDAFQVIEDGHHALAAAKRAGVEPNFIVQSILENDRIGLLMAGKTDDFLKASHVDSAWYDINSGREIW